MRAFLRAGSVALLAHGSGACGGGHQPTDGTADADTDADADADADADSDADADADSDADADTDTGTPATMPDCPGGKLDPSTGLCWQEPPAEASMTWSAAVAYCEDLDLGGETTWRLPSISDSRTLVRGCPQTETGGACRVTDSCPGSECWLAAECAICLPFGGPGPGGCYWDAALGEDCHAFYWSTTLPYVDYAWGVYPYEASIWCCQFENELRVRCVRPGP